MFKALVSVPVLSISAIYYIAKAWCVHSTSCSRLRLRLNQTADVSVWGESFRCFKAELVDGWVDRLFHDNTLDLIV